MSTQPEHEAMGIPQWTLGDRLRKVRTLAGLNQEDFAAKLDVTASAYSHWESDRTTPRNVVAIAQRIELLLGTPASWTLGLVESVPSPGGPGGLKKVSSVSERQPLDYKVGSSAAIFKFRSRPDRSLETSPLRIAS